jgi:hypothetical protein
MVLRAVMVAVLTMWSARAFAQDGLDRVRELYVSADYEGAIAELDRLPAATARDEQVERDRYRAMTLIALGRTPEAHAAIERVLLANPRFELSAEEAAPRIRLAFREVRERVLPLMARTLYTEGKSAFDRKDLEKAGSDFERAIAVIDLIPAGEPGMADLRVLVAGFLQLSRAARASAEPAPTGASGTALVPSPTATSGTEASSTAAKEVPPSAPATTPAAAPTTPAAPAPERVSESTATTGAATPPAPASVSAASPSPPAAASSAPRPSATASSPEPETVEPMTMTVPVALRQVLPPWKPSRNEQQPVFSGIIEVDIDEKGEVSAARMINAVHPSYDTVLLAAARDWKYEPARRAGVPVKSTKRVSVVLRSY